MKLKRVIRLDSMPLNRASFTEEGYLVDTPIVTSTGIFEYTNHDGSLRRELRLPEEVFDRGSLASYEGKPVIITHDAGLVTKDNVAENEVGTILTKGFRDGDNVRAKIIIHDTDEMKASGLKELSLGYNLDLDETPGVWNGERYDAVQRNIRINHLALVREARAGEQARLNIDGRGSELKGVKSMRYKKATTRRARRSDGILSPDELKEAIKEYRARHPEAGQAAPKQDEGEEMEQKNAIPPVAEDEDDMYPEAAQEIRDKQQAKIDAEEDDLNQANETIAHQDEDIQTLLDIIDTLLAERDFKGAKTDADEEPILPVEEQKTDADDEEFPMPEENTDEEEEFPAYPEEGQTDGEDDEIPFEENTDEDEDPYALENEDEDEEELYPANEDDADEDIPQMHETEVTHKEIQNLNADSIDAIVRTRVKLGIVAEKLHLDGLENMSLKRAKKAVIKVVRPAINLDGKSDHYINAMFDLACDDVKVRARKDTRYQKKQMFNRDSRRSVSRRGNSAEDARQRMIERRQNRRKSK